MSNSEIPVEHRQFILSVILALAMLMAPSVSDAQQKPRVYRIGVLGTSTFGFETDLRNCPVQGNSNWQAAIEGLQAHGSIRERNLVLECRWTGGQAGRMPSLAAEPVSLAPELLWAMGTDQVRAAKQATGTIPIVMTSILDPVGRGLVDRLAHHGGNVTGLTDTVAEM